MSNNYINIEISNELIEEINLINKKNDNLLYINKHFKDLSHLKTYSIDEGDTLEIDDAISLERISNDYKIWIHIASPASHIDYDSVIDQYARKLISSLYLANSTIYMFPEILINEIFSLRLKQNRRALSLGVVLNDDGSVISSEIIQTIITPNYQLSYEEADELIDYAPKEEEDLSIISNILDRRRSWRRRQGAKEIIEPYGKIIVKDENPIVKVIDQTLSRLLVSEAMILYGNLISIYTKCNKIPVPYRVQEGINNINPSSYNSDNKILYNFFMKKSMGKTYYSSEPLRHNSLGLESYIQATSPIRRYSDLIVQYQLNRFINNKCLLPIDEINKIIIEINRLSKQNTNRFREDQRLWQNKWFKNNKSIEYNIMLLNWINRYKNICILYFIEYKFSSICFLKTKNQIKIGEIIRIKDITINYKEILHFQLI